MGSDNLSFLSATGSVLSPKAGYGSAGASKSKRSFKGFDAVSGDAVTDINAHIVTLRQRSRVLYMAAPLATSAIRTTRTNVIGCGLALKSRLGTEALGLTQEDGAAIERKIEAEFSLWARDKYACDATGVNDFYEMQQLALLAWLQSGDVFALPLYRDSTWLRPYGLRLKLIEADRVSTPLDATIAGPQAVVFVDGQIAGRSLYNSEGVNKDTGNKIHDGVEVDGEGMVAAYYFCSLYPAQSIYLGNPPEWKRIEVMGSTGLPNVMHLMNTERPEQYRGVPFLAHVIEPLLQTRRYTESELMSALVESFFTVFVTKEAGDSESPLTDSVPEEDKVSFDDREIELGPGATNELAPGEKIEIADPKRPTSGFENFVAAIGTQLGAALEIPGELVLKSFNSNYSASRAALLEAWKAFLMWRSWFVSDFCQPAYEMWFSEAVAIGRVDAPGFFDDPIIRRAWLGAEWTGPSQGQLDPTKEVSAHLMALGAGLETHEQATIALNGGNWDSNIEQIQREIKLRDEAGIPFGKEEGPDEEETGKSDADD